MGLKDLTPKELLDIKDRDEKEQRKQQDEKLFKNVKVLIEACRIAQRHGAYTLEEARHIMNAIDILQTENTTYIVK